MRYALIADIHSNYQNLDKVLEHIRTTASEAKILNLGDTFEVKVSKEDLDTFQYKELSQVIDYSSDSLKVLKPGTFLIGNQEERMKKLIPEFEKTELGCILSYGYEKMELETAIITHGHEYEWLNPSDDLWHPEVVKMPNKNLIYGHNHRCELFKLSDNRTGIQYEHCNIEYGKEIVLNPDCRYLINVGDNKYSTPNWLLYDDEEQVAVYNRLFPNGKWNNN